MCTPPQPPSPSQDTDRLRYLLTDFNLGDLILKASSVNRKGALEVARSHFRAFIDLISAYELLSKDEKKAAEAASSANINTSYLPTDPGARRSAKIAQFKKEKELRARVEALSATTDDEDVRNFYRSSISLAVVQTVQSLEMIKMELEVLAHAPPKAETDEEVPGESDRRQPGIKNLEYSEKLDVLGGPIKGGALLSKDGKPLRPFTLLGKREALKAGVFRSGHNLPTMTIDEYLEEERARGGIIEGGGYVLRFLGLDMILTPNVERNLASDRNRMRMTRRPRTQRHTKRGPGMSLRRQTPSSYTPPHPTPPSPPQSP